MKSAPIDFVGKYLSFQNFVVGFLLAAAFYGTCVNFVPAESLYPWSLYGSAALSVIFFTWLCRANKIKFPGSASGLKRILSLAITFGFFSFGFISLVKVIDGVRLDRFCKYAKNIDDLPARGVMVDQG